LQVDAGVGIDAGGRLISLPTSGQGDIGVNPLVLRHKTKRFSSSNADNSRISRDVYVLVQFSKYFQKPTDSSDTGILS